MHAVIWASAIPEHLRGYSSRYLAQVAPNLYVGQLTPRVADHLWENLCRHSSPDSSLTMIRSDNNNETGYLVFHHGPNPYTTVEFDGLQLPAYTRVPPLDEAATTHTDP